MHPDVTVKVLERITTQGMGSVVDNLSGNSFDQLTNREKEVLSLIGRGLCNAEISSALYITEGTVKNHVSSLLAKFGARDRTQLALLSRKT